MAEGGWSEEGLMVTIVHQGGSRLTYPAYVTDSFVFLMVPMTSHKAFRLKDGRARSPGLMWWTVDPEDLKRCRRVSNQQRRPSKFQAVKVKRRAAHVT